jgi:SIR2-like domain
VSISAGSITVSQTLLLLDTEHTTFAEGVADGRYMFWLGSGISLGVVPGLHGVVLKVLKHLQSRMTPGDSDDRFRKALVEIIEETAGLNTDEKIRLDIDAPVESWPDRDAIIERLTQRYALMLDVGVEGEEADYLLWDGVDPATTYGTGLDPDAEHLCLAILGLEGVIEVMASANWDGLIEAAMREITEDPAQHLNVVVLQEDLRGEPVPIQLLKFHGCAVLARSGDPKYRRALVGRQGQITGWEELNDKAAVRTKMLSAASEKPTFMVGFSAQDTNIQRVFSAVKSAMPWPWPSDPPALAFAEDQLGPWQKQVLKATYGDDVYAANRGDILTASLIRAYGKPLLTAFVLDVLTRKAQALIRSADGLASADADALCGGVTAVRDTVAATAGTGTKDFITALLAATARAVSLFRRGSEPSSLTIYDRLTMQPAGQVAAAPAVDSDGVREMAVSLALLGRGAASSAWSLDVAPTTSGTNGALRVTDPGGTDRAVFLTASGKAAVELSRTGPMASGASDAIVIRCDDPAEPLARSPSAPPGRTGSAAEAEVTIRQLLRDSSDLAGLHRGFCLQAGLPA